MELQYQQFRKADIIEKVCVRIASTFTSNGNPSCYVSLQDIRDAFPDAARFKLNGLPIPFFIDPNGNRIEPPCIAFYPNKVLDVITEAPQPNNININSNSNSNNSNIYSNTVIHLPGLRKPGNQASQESLLPLSNLIQSFNLFLITPSDTQIEAINSNLEKIAELLLEASKKDEKINLLEAQAKGDTMNNLLLEVKEKDDKIVSLLLEAKDKGDDILRLQDKVLCLQDKILKLQSEAKEKDDKVQHHSTYKESGEKVLENAMKTNGGSYDLHLGKATITLKSRDRAEEFFNALTNAKRVYDLDVTFDWDWTETDLAAFGSALTLSSISILRLGLGRSQGNTSKKVVSTSKGHETLARIIELSNMKMIHIVLPPDLIKLLILWPRRPPHLHKLTFEMGFHSIGASGLPVLVNSLKTSTTLAILNLENNLIRVDGTVALSEALRTNTSLTALNLCRNAVEDKGAVALSEALKTNTTLTILELGSNSIGVKGAIALSAALKANNTLTILDLSSNSIGKKGSLALSEALKVNTSLITLNLGKTLIENQGILALSKALKVNKTLITLDLKGNTIGEKGALALSEATKARTTLTIHK
ncbi:hypothetical protein BX616_008857 [Lobosporangium transversale]|uniref:Uncharacterized protein n=1 Tax=Lobosporangium transversale TaxID=64571 RepID=A0A1Y2H1J6_9FUNG|nr:hypothetical protein BCR41DRAFT_123433 [Lobosporangium transversale]KAF9914149.1 hypothetical protein BX616_008857 [Lobosporangium transversale]ORZ27871.1 hypothetical protein BCR41DRAFT_123433 [Lobosporangium transversale]|eukprot:XP_021885574.1 hypothetical protein BCR41DRAFT_123433 [Lobosporangium transversale]